MTQHETCNTIEQETENRATFIHTLAGLTGMTDDEAKYAIPLPWHLFYVRDCDRMQEGETPEQWAHRWFEENKEWVNSYVRSAITAEAYYLYTTAKQREKTLLQQIRHVQKAVDFSDKSPAFLKAAARAEDRLRAELMTRDATALFLLDLRTGEIIGTTIGGFRARFGLDFDEFPTDAERPAGYLAFFGYVEAVRARVELQKTGAIPEGDA